MEDIKCLRCVYRSSGGTVQGGVASKENEGQFIPILDVVTPEVWFHPPSNLIIVDNFDLKKGKYSRIFFTQGSQGAPWLLGYPEALTGSNYSELSFGMLVTSDYLPRRLEQLIAAYNKKNNIKPPIPAGADVKKRVLKKKRPRK